MQDREINDNEEVQSENMDETPVVEMPEETEKAPAETPSAALEEMNNKYLRLYAEFENYRKRVAKDKEELIRYGNESLLYELLTAIDHLELALKHSSDDPKSGLVQGVEITLKELMRTLEKFGLTRIGAVGLRFDPAVHHAMMQVERDDMDENMVAEEMRAGYMYRDKVLRPSLVSVSIKPTQKTAGQEKGAQDTNEDENTFIIEEES